MLNSPTLDVISQCLPTHNHSFKKEYLIPLQNMHLFIFRNSIINTEYNPQQDGNHRSLVSVLQAGLEQP